MKARAPMYHWNKSARELATCHSPDDVNSVAGYIRISRNNKVLYLHRWLWEELVGPIPVGHTIDHKNGIKHDCRLVNLRCVPEVINLRNSSMRSDNTSGVTGVSFWASGNAWRAVAYHHTAKKQRCKTFSVLKYGDEMAFIMACDARQDMVEELNQQGAGYTARHGK